MTAVIVFLNSVRVSFPTLGEPEDYQGNKQFRWSATALIPKTDTAQIKKVEAALLKTAQEKWGPKGKQFYDAIMGDKNKCCYLDGSKSTYDGYEGCMSLAAHRYVKDSRPLVYDSDKTPIYQADNTMYPGKGGRIYGGCYVNMEVEFFAQDNKHGKGLRCTLRGIQRVKDGDSFGGASKPDSEAFGEVAEGADADDDIS